MLIPALDQGGHDNPRLDIDVCSCTGTSTPTAPAHTPVFPRSGIPFGIWNLAMGRSPAAASGTHRNYIWLGSGWTASKALLSVRWQQPGQREGTCTVSVRYTPDFKRRRWQISSTIFLYCSHWHNILAILGWVKYTMKINFDHFSLLC